MRRIHLLIAAFLLTLTTFAGAQTPDLTPLLKNLASPNFATRQTAQKQLDAIPPEQYDALTQLLATQSDPEVQSRLQSRTHEMLRQLLAKHAAAPLRAAAHLTGRLVNAAGKPVAQAKVQANSPAWGFELANALQLSTISDSQGRFDLPLPYPELLYQVSVVCPGYDFTQGNSIIVGQHTDMGDLTLRSSPMTSVQGVLTGADGKPVAQQKVEIVAETQTASAITDDTGHFDVQNLATFGNTGYPGQIIPAVHINGQTVPVEIIRQPAMAHLELKLVPAASVSGKVSTDSGQPLAGATVLLRPFFMSGLLLTATSAADGSYHFTDVPPGDFIIAAEAPGYTRLSPHIDETRLPLLKLAPGDAAARDIVLQPMAILRGTVLDHAGKPLPDALVGIISTWRGNYSNQWRCVQTDAAGRFIIASGHTVERTNQPDTHLIAFSGAEGFASVPARLLTPGELREVTIKLPGSAHLAGTLVDGAGKGVEAIMCRTNGMNQMLAISSAAGTFDFGRISLPADGAPLQLNLQAPRPCVPPRGVSSSTSVYISGDPIGSAPPFTQLKDAPAYYAHQDVTVKLEEAATQKITLKPVKLLQFQGTVLKPDGTPAANAEVYILTGDANATTWVQSVRPISMGSSFIPTSHDQALAAGKADKDGHFNVFAVREEGTAAILDADKWDYAHFKIGTWLGGQATLTDQIDMPTESKSDFKLTLGQ